MKEYHKIQTVYLRDPVTNFKTLLDGQFALPEFEYLKNNNWIFTEKVDGTNIRVMIKGEEITFGGKTDVAQIPSHLVTVLNNMFLTLTTRQKIKEVFEDGEVCLYGEGYGKKIQKGGGNYISDACNFILFDIKIGDWWLSKKDVEDIARKLVISTVPVIGAGTLEDLVVMAKEGFNSKWGEFKAEGIVARPEVELKARNGKRIITKIKYKDFAHQNKDN